MAINPLAWCDESIVKEHGSTSSRYLIGASLCGLDEKTIRTFFIKEHLVKRTKAHWHDMTLPERRKSIAFIDGLNLVHIVASVEFTSGITRPERARRRCLEHLLPVLEQDYSVAQVFMEGRTKQQNNAEITFIQGLRSRGFFRVLRYDLMPGSQDARLWIPDQILGAVGSADRSLFHPQNVIRLPTTSII
ncbi:hypothetical protein [Bifidobacterium sp. ESL0790]|uniref:hypothetical protein n=1 Tax=Bifidobacterium sp. ESL0790 TaxID=2983233 RepID=UPI0023F85CCB|nr:hypothetical protein [Bifidobacterium sp. ESL0790]WEV72285.1 hypothetical protein OZY47_07625 [Bifidobacterium sp. ESL0790]